MSVSYTATVGGFDYGFDFEDQRIDVDASLSVVNVSQLYTAIKEAQASLPGQVYPRIANGGGLEVLSGGVSTFLTVSLLALWELNALTVAGSFEVGGGNLVRVDEADPFRDNPLITYLNNLSQAGTTTAVGSGVTPGDVTAIAAAVRASLSPELAMTATADVILSGDQDFNEASKKLTITKSGRTLEATATTNGSGEPIGRGELTDV